MAPPKGSMNFYMKVGFEENSYYTQDGINGAEISIFEIWALDFSEIAPDIKSD